MSRIHVRISLASFALAAAFAHAPPALAQYDSPVDPPGSIASEALGLNDNGLIVGEYSVQTGTAPNISSFQYGFVDNQGVFTTLAPNPDSGGYGAMCNAAWGVNNAGDVVGTYFTNDGAAHGFLYMNGNYSTFTELNVPGAGSTQAFGISNNGLVVGQAIESSGDLGFTYDISTSQYDTFTLPGLPSGATFVPFGINNAGEVVGTYSSPSGEVSVFLYTPGSSSYTLLPQNPAAVIGFFEGTFGVGIDDAGDLAGNYSVDGSLGLGFLPYVYLDGTYANFNVNLPSADVYNSGADGINNLGDVVGYYSAPNGELQGFLATPAPEASTWAMMLVAFVGLGFASHRARGRALLRA
jgi:probable HAF family extracellular repeat protein